MSVIPPNNNTTLIIDDFINYATAHLSTVTGIVNTISLYPPLGTPAPGVLPWSGYQVQPATPGGGALGVPPQEIVFNEAQQLASDTATLEGSNINEATSAGFEVSFEAPPPPTVEIEQVEYQLLEEARNEPDPPLSEEDKPKDDIPPQPNYKTNVKVPNELVVAMKKYRICTTNIERAHFLAQCEHESGGFRYKQEIWGPTAAQSGYEGRGDLGNVQKGDGYKFKGRGYIQLTGRANYRKFGPIAGADFEGNPDSVATQYFADTACMFWKTNNLVNRCKDSTTTSIKLVTKKINGGYNGIDDRIKKFTKYWTELQKDPTLWS